MPNTNEIAKQTLITINQRKLKPTPENYSEIFEELSQKYKIGTTNKEKIEKYKSLLIPNYQQEIKQKHIKTLEELISFLISRLNMQNKNQNNEFFELLKIICKVLQISKDKQIKDLAFLTDERISKNIDSENIFLLEKKWKELEKKYNDIELDNKVIKYGVKSEDDFISIIKKLLENLDLRSYEKFSKLISICLKPSLVDSIKINAFIEKLKDKPFILGEEKFENELNSIVNQRISMDNTYVQKNLSFFDQNLEKINKLLLSLKNINEENLDFVNTLTPEQDGFVKIGFDDLKNKFSSLDEKVNSINAQLKLTQNSDKRESWNISDELSKLDENYLKYKVNYALALYSISNFEFIMEKYGVGSLNEIFVRFKKILKESCDEIDELWMIDEKSYLVVLPGKSLNDVQNIVEKNINIIENFRFIYKQDMIVPKIKSFFMDKQSNPDENIFEKILIKIENNANT